MAKKDSSKESESGLLKRSKPVFLAVAKILKPHALRGEVSVELISDFPERLQPGKEVYLGKDHTPRTIKTIRKSDKRYLIAFEGHSSRNDVEPMRNIMVYVKSSEVPVLGENEYYHHDLIGLQVLDVASHPIGILKEVITTGANDVYVIQPADENEKEILIPAIRSIVKKVDIGNRLMVIEIPEWM